MSINRPKRLEAWDACTSDKGWALDVNEVRAWLIRVLAECESNRPDKAVKRIKRFIAYLE